MFGAGAVVLQPARETKSEMTTDGGDQQFEKPGERWGYVCELTNGGFMSVRGLPRLLCLSASQGEVMKTMMSVLPAKSRGILLTHV